MGEQGKTKRKQKEGMVNTVLRIPEETYNQVKMLAIDQKRSINNQILVILEDFFNVNTIGKDGESHA